MAKRNALIRRLPEAETLGCATVICSDKTGTLTRNEMTVTTIYSADKNYSVKGAGYKPKGKILLNGSPLDKKDFPKELFLTLQAGYLCNNAELYKNREGQYKIKGSPTEGALIVTATKASLTEKLPQLDEIPFESENQYMATLHKGKNENIIYVKGSPEKILTLCKNQLLNGELKPLNSHQILEKSNEMAQNALRVLAMAYKPADKEKTSLDEDKDLKDPADLIFLGLQGMLDPCREEAIEAVKKCKRAGVRVIMITGDHLQTAKAIAGELGIGEGEQKVLTGEDIQNMNEEELYEAVDKVSIYARVAPEHKFNIVKQLHKRGEIVAVTGDGVNDAPALKSADIGISMGITGTEVSKEASDMILTDDNFASIVDAIEEGRHTFNNIWKVILYLLPTNGGQMLVLMGAILLSPFIPLFAKRLPLEPIQIHWVNLVIALGCAIPLSHETKEMGILDKPPRNIKEPLANPFFLQRVGLVSVVEMITVFTVFVLANFSMQNSGIENHLAKAGTAAFTALIFVEVFYVFTARSARESAFALNFFSNKWVPIGAAITLGLQIILVYSLPLFGISPFKTVPFPPQWWLIILLFAPAGFIAVETEKLIRRKVIRASESIRAVEKLTLKEIHDPSLHDELMEIVVEQRGAAEDRFDRLIKKCEMLDLEYSVSLEKMFELACDILIKRASSAPPLISQIVGINKKDLFNLFVEREKEANTVISPGIAIPHAIMREFKEFDILVIRCREGISFPNVSPKIHTIFILAGHPQERNFYLRCLAAITQIIQDKGFEENWLKAENTGQMKNIILSAERKRIGIV
jgi:magnesium-transporting ATPase (P-type)/mannitol/fructose-specific phosphotransferase system IIA component (Ntr-type)